MIINKKNGWLLFISIFMVISIFKSAFPMKFVTKKQKPSEEFLKKFMNASKSKANELGISFFIEPTGLSGSAKMSARFKENQYKEDKKSLEEWEFYMCNEVISWNFVNYMDKTVLPGIKKLKKEIIYAGFGAGDFEKDFRILAKYLLEHKDGSIKAIHLIDVSYDKIIYFIKALQDSNVLSEDAKKMKEASLNFLKSNYSSWYEFYGNDEKAMRIYRSKMPFVRFIKFISSLSSLHNKSIPLHIHRNVDYYLKYLKLNKKLKKANFASAFYIAIQDINKPNFNKQIGNWKDDSIFDIFKFFSRGIQKDGLLATTGMGIIDGKIEKITKDLQKKYEQCMNKRKEYLEEGVRQRKIKRSFGRHTGSLKRLDKK